MRVKKIGWILDYETRSRAEISWGAYRYAIDPSTEATCLAMAPVYMTDTAEFEVGFEEIKKWDFRKEYDPFEFDILPNEMLFSHNAMFEYYITNEVMHRKHGAAKVKISQLYCTATLCSVNGLPHKLSEAGKAAGVETEKDIEGNRLVIKMCKPDKDGNFPYSDEMMDRVVQYCDGDIITTGQLLNKLTPFTEQELAHCHMSFTIDDRGIPLDMELATNARDMVDMEKERIGKLVPINLKSVKQVKEYAADRGLIMESTDADHIQKYLKMDLVPELRTVLEAKALGVGSASVAKFEAMVNSVGFDGRLRSNYRHHGAMRTGRYTANGVQVTNLPRGAGYTHSLVPELREMIKAKDMDGLAMLTDNRPIDALVGCVRSVIAAPDDHIFVQRDLSAIEARGVLWAADAPGIKVFTDFDKGIGEEPYMIMAKKLNPNKPDRFMGKQNVLSCVAEGTPVLTDKGWVAIEDVTDTHKVFDGDEFVSCEGSVYNGDKPVACDYWLPITEDHKVLHEGGWDECQNLNQKTFTSACKLATLKLLKFIEVSEEGLKESPPDVVAAMSHLLTSGMSLLVGQPGAMRVLNESPVTRNLSTQVFSRRRNSRECGLVESLPSTAGVTNLRIKAITAMEDEVLRLVLQHAQNFSSISGRLMDLTTLLWNSTGSTTTGGTVQEIFGWLLEVSKSVTDQTQEKSTTMEKNSALQTFTKSIVHRISAALQYIGNFTMGSAPKPLFGTKRIARVHDVKNAGPNHRFMIMTGQGPLIVHNCGYGVGKNAFIQLCDGYGKVISEKEAEDCINLYKQYFPEVVQFWKDVEAAGLSAIQHLGRVTEVSNRNCKVRFTMKGRNLQMKLPSGRILTYWGARAIPGKYGEVISFMSKSVTGWHRNTVWGGAMTGHIVQGFCNCILRDIMMRMEAEGIPVIMHVHDEVVTMTKLSEAESCFNRLESIMKTPPAWAKGLPIQSAGWINKFYIKD